MGKASRKKKRLANVVANIENRNLESLTTPIKVGLLYKPIVHILLILTLGFLAYSNTFNVPFQFDDKPVIIENPIIKNLRLFIEPSEAKVYSEHFQYPTFSMRYIGYLTFALNYKVRGLDVTGYHFVNLFIHIINGLLVYLLIVITFRTPFLYKSPLKDYSRLIAIFAALLFVCHPIQTQAVTYIWQRVTSLAAMFYLLSLAMYIKVRLGQTTEAEVKAKVKFFSASTLTFYLLSIVSAILAMKTKEIAFTLPIIITLYEFMFFDGKFKRKVLYLIPILLTILIIPLSLTGTDKPIGDLIGDVSEETRVETEMSRLDYLFTQFRVIVTYIRLLFLPINQNLDYDYPVYDSFLNLNVFLSFLFLLSILILGIYLLYRSRSEFTELQTQNSEHKISPTRYTLNATRLIAFGIFWFFITLSVESSIIPINDIIFEHRVYLPSVGAIVALNTSVFYALHLIAHRTKIHMATGFWILAAIVIVLSIATYQRNFVWKDEINLWEDVVRKSPNKAGGHNNLGQAYRNEGWTDRAIMHYQIALRIKPNAPEIHNNLGNAYRNKGWIDRAIMHYQIALRIKPDFGRAYNNLGLAYHEKGLLDIALKYYQLALELTPDYSEKIHNNLGVLFKDKGWLDSAVEHFQIALRLNPDYAEAHNNLGVVYERKGLLDEAIKEYQIALRLNPEDRRARNNLNRIFWMKK